MYGHRREADRERKVIVGIAADLAIGDTYRPVGNMRWRHVVARTTTLHRDEVVVGFTVELSHDPESTGTAAHDALTEVEYEVFVDQPDLVLIEMTEAEAKALRRGETGASAELVRVMQELLP